MKQVFLAVITTLYMMATISCNGQKQPDNSTSVSEGLKKSKMENQGQKTIDIAMAFMGAMGKGDMKTMKGLMHEEMVWQNAGDPRVPWIGPWKGKKTILEDFMPKFGAGFKTIKWEPDDAIASGDTAAFFGQMIGELTNNGEQTTEFTYALRVKVKDGKVILWNWFEDSYEVSRAYSK